MTKSNWVFRLTQDVKANGNYKASFDVVINTLADILSQRDKVMIEFNASGEKRIVNGRKNPHITLWDDLNKTALAYMRELGLTVASLRKIDEGAIKQPKQSPLEEVLKRLEA